jgi:hypothetical protein
MNEMYLDQIEKEISKCGQWTHLLNPLLHCIQDVNIFVILIYKEIIMGLPLKWLPHLITMDRYVEYMRP